MSRTCLVEITLSDDKNKDYLSEFEECDDIEKIKVIKEIKK